MPLAAAARRPAAARPLDRCHRSLAYRVSMARPGRCAARLRRLRRHPGFDFAVVADVIDCTEPENDAHASG
jgi:hypothetical protein